MLNITIKEAEEKILNNILITEEEVLQLLADNEQEKLYSFASRITNKKKTKVFDMCSIINAKSGKCTENCKWCSQSIYSNSVVKVYDILSKEECYKLALHNQEQGVNRFSLVTSGRRLTKQELEQICEIVFYIKERTNINICASLGLLSENDLKELKAAGIIRYHCNLETAPSFFPYLCTTHTVEQKVNTLKFALNVGMEICSGGIIGMGESMKQRVEFATALRELNVNSIPINILIPIKGTSLENQKPLSVDEFLLTVAIFRIILPMADLRFAGGRISLSRDTMERAMKIGINSAIVGDMLTTTGCDISEDKKLIKKTGYLL